MTTFTLKKYEIQKPDEQKKEEIPNEPQQEKQVTIKIEGSISEIIANSLNKLLQQNNSELTETKDETPSTSVKAITTEDINTDPVTCYKNIEDNDVLYIASNGFKTAAESWFLYNVSARNIKTFYTQEALLSYLKQKVLS